MIPNWWNWLEDLIWPTPIHWAHLVGPGLRAHLMKIGSMGSIRVSPQEADTLVEFSLITGESREILLEHDLFLNDHYAEMFKRLDDSLK